MKKPDWKLWLKDKDECKLWLGNYTKKQILRKDKDESSIYLKKSEHNLNLANWINDKHNNEIPQVFGNEAFYDWAIVIYYYAVYHAALALVSKLKYKTKSHAAAICFLIHYYYHRRKIVDEEDIELAATSLSGEDIETLTAAKSMRERASYDVHAVFEKTIAEDAKAKSAKFLNKVREVLEKL